MKRAPVIQAEATNESRLSAQLTEFNQKGETSAAEIRAAIREVGKLQRNR